MEKTIRCMLERKRSFCCAVHIKYVRSHSAGNTGHICGIDHRFPASCTDPIRVLQTGLIKAAVQLVVLCSI